MPLDDQLTLPKELDCYPYIELFLQVARQHRQCATWIDLGFGGGGPALKVRQPELRCVGVDVVTPASVPAPWDFVHADIGQFVASSSPDTKVVVTMFDVIEHLDRPTGEGMLVRLCELYGAQLIFTPLGFFHQDEKSRPDLAQQPAMWHRSGWVPSDFAALGFLPGNFPLAHSRHGATLAVKLFDWTLAERHAVAVAFRHLYLRRCLHPKQWFRRARSAAFYWFGDSRPYAVARSIRRQQ